jgi:serine/threonine protein kinase
VAGKSVKNAAYWALINELFDQVIALPESDRPARLLELGDEQPELIDDLCQLVGAHDQAEQFLEIPAAVLSPSALSGRSILPREKPLPLREGAEVGDFVIISQIGEGSFARVYKAQQKSLQRTVAIKVAGGADREARNMAALDHDHIVRVFLETRYPSENLHIICMQYVAGITLAGLITGLKGVPPADRSGAAVIAVIDNAVSGNVAFDANAAKDRQMLASSTYFSTCLWIGARLAEALDFAHARGVLHLDVKPANILLNQYGRPLLTDFNVAMNISDSAERPVLLGGTVNYMSPEQEQAFATGNTAGNHNVGRHSDIYSLGVVLAELMLCRRTRVEKSADGRESVIAHSDQLPDEVAAALHRAVMPDPHDRYESGRDFADALTNCRDLLEIQRVSERDDRWLQHIRTHPLLALIMAAIVPQILGSIINITYNSIRIAADLTPQQQQTFQETILPYNLAVYPLGILIVASQVLFIVNNIKVRRDRFLPDPASMAALRKRAVASPVYLFAACSVGWLPGAVLFPSVVDWMSGPVATRVYWHFGLSFVTSWLVALTYSYFLLELLVVTMVYSRLWTGCCNLRVSAETELAPVRRRLKMFQMLAGAIPLFGALMIVTSSSADIDPDRYRVFQFMIVLLIAMAICGFVFALKVGDKISAIIALYTRKK